jgi:predicted nuclease with RNAse H fold
VQASCATPARTLGIDLAAAPERTAVCAVTWEGGTAVAEVLPGPHDDAHLIALMAARWDKIGIDAPLGWPEPFVDAIAAHRELKAWPGRDADPIAHRRQLRYRLTDLVVAERDRRPPLSVSTDLIGVVALRAALLLDEYARATKGEPVRRDGLGPVAEVYPAAALRRWLPETRGSYKRRGECEPLHALVGAVADAVPIKFAGDSHERCTTSHDAFDALVCALVARAVTRDQTRRARSGVETRRAATEGWIHVPKRTAGLAGLARRSTEAKLSS